MNYYIHAIFKAISQQAGDVAATTGNRLQIMIPYLSEMDTQELLDLLSNFAHDHQWRLIFKVADECRPEWKNPAIAVALADSFAGGNLTQYRNEIQPNDPATLLVFVGVALVTDKGGLADFYQCDNETLWVAHMGGSFREWIVPFFENHGVRDFSENETKFFNDILLALCIKSDLTAVSRLLEDSVFRDDYTSAKDLIADVLGHLSEFELPNLAGFTAQLGRLNARRGFMYYMEAATAFLNYDAFLEFAKRKKALGNIKKFREQGKTIPDACYASHFANQDALLDALAQYIDTGDRNLCPALTLCDFVYLYDSVLLFRPKEEGAPPKSTLYKLSGSPVEVVLRAVWQTFEKYSGPEVSKIVLTGMEYRHDCQLEGTTAEIHESAFVDLQHLLGGIDQLCESHISVIRDPEISDEPLPVESTLLRDQIVTKSAKTSEPYFRFTVTLENEDDPFVQHFGLKLPETHPYRLAATLFKRAHEALSSFTSPCSLPVFHLEYYKEFMMAREHEELCRVMLHCLNASEQNIPFAENIFTSEWVKHPSSEAMKPYLQAVSLAYRSFLEQVTSKGLYTALEFGGTPDVFNKYNAAATAFTKDVPSAKQSYHLAALLMRSFLFIERKPKLLNIDEWAVNSYEPSGVVTVLHPALLEMLQSQIVFLFAVFSKAATQELQRPGMRFKKAHWSYYVDMAEMKMPLTGLTVDSNNKFELCTNGQDLFHRIGEITPDQALATTRFLIRYDRVDDEEIAEAELFRESSESRHLLRVLKEYNKMHISADDGISLAVYRNDDIQPVLAALNQYVIWLHKEIFKGRDLKDKYAVRVVFFSESSDTNVISSWLARWQDFLDEAEDKDGDYGDCSFTVFHRIVKVEDGYKQFADTIKKQIDSDIFVFYNFIRPGSDGCVFKMTEEFNAIQDSLKFPVLEKAQCSSTLPSERFRRSQVVSNRQFKISTNHTEVIARLRDRNAPQGLNHFVLATGDFSPWQEVINSAHLASEWVVCIDASIDEALIGSDRDGTRPKRELIGYGSGVGLHGECNYTISTQKFFMDDINRILLASMRTVYNYGDVDHDKVIADRFLKESKSLAGISLIRALGPSEYIRDFMAYCLMHRILPLDDKQHLCDKIFSIDAYHHWFDQASEDDRTHPDLLWLRAGITAEGRIHIDAKVIECKMANTSSEHLEKAKKQIKNGVKVLADVFTPNQGGMAAMHRPDQRYWYLQLHRLIASCARIPSSHDEQRFLQAMERLTAGDYEISWGAGVFAFWTDSLDRELRCNTRFDVVIGTQVIDVPVFTAGYDFVYHICASDEIQHLDWGAEVLQAPTGPGEAVTQERPVEELPIEEEEINDVIDVGGVAPSSDDGVGSQPSTATDLTAALPVDADATPSGLISGIPQRILLGRTVNGNKDVYWEFGHPKLNNRHFLIFGNSGMGKTYAIQAILCELGKQQQNSLIVDYTNGFLNNQLQEITKEVLAPVQYIVKTKKLPINPFAKQSQDIGDGEIISDENIDVAKRVTSIFDTVYNLGLQQVSVMIDAIGEGLNKSPLFMMEDLLSVLESFVGDEIHPKSSVLNTISKIKPFISQRPFVTTATSVLGWHELFSDQNRHCHVFQMTMMDRLSYLILTEFILWDLYSFVRSSGNESNPRVIVLDEVQNLDQRLDAPLGKYLTEGRKFGVSLIAATQTLSNLKTDEQARLFQAAHKLFFKPADSEISQYADLARNAAQSGDLNEWKQRLTSLGKGECLSIGPGLNERTGELMNTVQKICISSLEERGF